MVAGIGTVRSRVLLRICVSLAAAAVKAVCMAQAYCCTSQKQPHKKTVDAIYRRSLAASVPCVAVVFRSEKQARCSVICCTSAAVQQESLTVWLYLGVPSLTFRILDGKIKHCLLWLF
jgi:hypothetical protein